DRTCASCIRAKSKSWLRLGLPQTRLATRGATPRSERGPSLDVMLDLLGGRSGKRARCTRAATGADPNPDAGWRFESDALVIASYVVCRGVNGAIDAPSVDLGATVDAESPSGSPRSWRPEIACV